MHGGLKMRKVTYTIEFNNETFVPYIVIKMLGEDGKVTELFREEITAQLNSKYTPEQQAKINQVNNVMIATGNGVLTEEECDWMLDPNSFKAYMEEDLEEEKLQRLAGFKVEKKITYFNNDYEEHNVTKNV